MKQEACVSAMDLGKRAARLREQRALSVSDVARMTGAATADVERFEKTGDGSAALLIALSNTLSSGNEPSTMLTIPKFDSLDDVEAYESRRRVAR